MEFKKDVLRAFCEMLKKANRAKGVPFALKYRGKDEPVIAKKDLTHADRKVLLHRLRKAKPAHRGVPLDVYGESQVIAPGWRE
jgi:hypothetical protein